MLALFPRHLPGLVMQHAATGYQLPGDNTMKAVAYQTFLPISYPASLQDIELLYPTTVATFCRGQGYR